MDFTRKLDQAQNLSDLFELVKRTVEAVLGRTRAGRPSDPDLRGYDAVLPEPRVSGCRVAAVGIEPRIRAGFRPRIRLVHRVTTSSRGSDRETRNTPHRYAALGGGRWRLRPRGKPSRNSLARSC